MHKSFIILFIAIMLIFPMSIQAFAHDGVTNAEWGTPVIDCIKDDVWKNAKSIIVAEETIVDVGAQTATAEVWSLWDGDYLYFFAEVKDPKVDAVDRDDAWNQDAVGFMIDYAYNREKEVSFRDLGDKSYAGYVNVAAYDGTKNYPETPTIFGIKKYIDGIKSACKVVSTGYIVEIRIPLLYKNYIAGDKIGYEICVNNSIGEGKRESQTVWKFKNGAEGQESWRYTYNMGTLLLSEKPAQPIPAAVTTAPDKAPTTSDITLTAIAFAAVASAVLIVLSKKRFS